MSSSNTSAVRDAAAKTMKSYSVDAIGHFNKQEIERILPEIQRQQKTKKDFIVPAAKLAIDDKQRVALAGVTSFKVGDVVVLDWDEAETLAKQNGEKIEVQKGDGSLPMKRHAYRQLCNRMNLPLDTADRFVREGQSDLVAHVLNTRLHAPRIVEGTVSEDGQSGEPKYAAPDDKFLVRTLDGNVRAVLSNSYRTLDNVDLFFCAANEFEKPHVSAELWQMRLWDNGFEMLAVSSSIKGNVTTDRTYDPGDGWISRWANLEGDTQYAAIRITNSETGSGGLTVAPAVMTRVCANFCVWAKTLRQVHLQRRVDEEGLIKSQDVAYHEAKMIWAKVVSAIATVFDPEAFAQYIVKMNKATQQVLGEDQDAVTKSTDNVLAHFEIAEERRASIIAKLIGSNDVTRYGLTQALTFNAHVADQNGEAEFASDLEAIGGELVGMSDREFKSLLV